MLLWPTYIIKRNQSFFPPPRLAVVHVLTAGQRSTKRSNTCVKEPESESHCKCLALRHTLRPVCVTVVMTPSKPCQVINHTQSSSAGAPTCIMSYGTRRESVCVCVCVHSNRGRVTTPQEAAIVPVERPGYRCP